MNTSTSAEDRTKVWGLIKDISIAMMVTSDAAGRWSSRPMASIQKSFDDALWFMSDRRSLKTDELKSNPKVLLAYSDPKTQSYVSVTGKGRIVEDSAKVKELWSEGARVWFPKGPDDPNIALIAVEVEEAEYWDTHSSTMIYAYGYLKARLTGERPKGGELGDHGKVGF